MTAIKLIAKSEAGKRIIKAQMNAVKHKNPMIKRRVLNENPFTLEVRIFGFAAMIVKVADLKNSVRNSLKEEKLVEFADFEIQEVV